MKFFRWLFGSGKAAELRRRADAELADVRETTAEILRRNSAYFYQRPDAMRLQFEAGTAPKPRDVSGLFVLGIVMEILERMPALPTSPYDRSFIHTAAYFSEDDPENAKTRILEIKAQFESLDQVASSIVQKGREAVFENDPTGLSSCYDAVARHNLMTQNF